MNLRRRKSPGDIARIAALSADQAPTAIIGCPHMTEPPFTFMLLCRFIGFAASASFSSSAELAASCLAPCRRRPRGLDVKLCHSVSLTALLRYRRYGRAKY